ncbi:MAG: cupin domain-containing protein [Bryobacterales bacterium]|jgi:quercetin dioxygenase-like cupin family protein|nr:cupin domain-containing protein [Bryobacterales bacterium]
MTQDFVYHEDIRKHSDIPPNGILSATLQTDARSKVVQFVFAPGQELSAHTAPCPALLYFASGQAKVTLGEETREASEGTFIHMAAKLPHAIHATTEVVMLLVMLKG